MNQAQAQNVVLGTMIVIAAVVVHDNLKHGRKATPPFGSLVALLVIGGALAMGAAVAPELAGPLALLVGLAVVVSRVGVKA